MIHMQTLGVHQLKLQFTRCLLLSHRQPKSVRGALPATGTPAGHRIVAAPDSRLSPVVPAPDSFCLTQSRYLDKERGTIKPHSKALNVPALLPYYAL